jgi:hypothetical protein
MGGRMRWGQWVLVAALLSGCAKPLSASRGSLDPGQVAGPERRAGLWEQTLVGAGHRVARAPLRICVDNRAGAKSWLFGDNRPARDCQRTFTHAADGTWRFVSTCRLGKGATLTSSGVARGDFVSRYEIRSTLEVSGAPLAALDGSREVDVVGRYRGPCPTGMAPGDVRLGDRLKLSAGHAPAAAAFTGV